MEFRFDAYQPYQLDAIAAVVDLFEGQPRVETDLHFVLGASAIAAVPNRLDLSDDALLANLHTVQSRNAIRPDPKLETIEREIETGAGDGNVRFYNYSVEMETGTGKTYVYLRTALELHRRYGMRKFIVVVPSVAIREGVLKTLQVTRKHFRGLYDNVPYRYYAYDSANLSQIRQFALSDTIEIMVMTLAAFNKDANVIRQTTDRLQGETPIHLVQAARPILILDEPQNMESEISIAALASLNPLMGLRYSATHRNPYNVVYRLTPFEAYRQGLVKRIEVASVAREDAYLQPYIRLVSVRTQKRTITARMTVHTLTRAGTVSERTLTLRPGDSLEDKTHRSEYAGLEIDEINPGFSRVYFANGAELAVGEEVGADREAIFEAQIRYTVEEHLRKQRHLRERGIKVLSLFFIDQVANYAPQDGVIRVLFSRAFEEMKTRDPEWRDLSADDVQAAYFAQRRTREGVVIVEDSKTGEAQRDREAYDLIMKDKERLLSFEEPVAFIFSHSALREGWDNPNVFQICTLNQTVSPVKKRQEIGRGVRLAVNQGGERVRDEAVNVLTVAANESYAGYVAALQSEFVEAGYPGTQQPPVRNKREQGTVRLRKEYLLKPEFEELWKRIKDKTRYRVEIDSERLIEAVAADLNEETIPTLAITVQKVRLDVTDEDALVPLITTGAKTALDLAGRYPLPNLVTVMEKLLVQTSNPSMRLSRGTLLEVYRRTRQQAAAIANPLEFAKVAVRIIKRRLIEQIVDGIRYHKTGDWYGMELFDEEKDLFARYVVQAGERSLYDHVPCDSDVERDFAEKLDQDQRVKLFIKLPSRFTVPTPLGQYNPDWAVVAVDTDAHGEETERLYLVAETKGTEEEPSLRPKELQKITCGRAHFEGALDGVKFRAPITDPAQLWD